jgi:hypothetical protein
LEVERLGAGEGDRRENSQTGRQFPDLDQPTASEPS